MAALETHLHETEAFRLLTPSQHTVPFVLNSPHSGRNYPDSFLASSRLSAAALRRSEDCYVDELFDAAPSLGVPMLAAQFPRAYVDVNREPYELDPELFGQALPDYANSRSARVVGGLGTIARVVTENDPIYRDPPSLADALDRIERLYKPYHATLTRLVDGTHARFGWMVLIDAHSMPSGAVPRFREPRADFVLGDRYGRSCQSEVTRSIARLLERLGYTVCLNKPYAGGFITEHYGRPASHRHAVQLEINRALYMDEETLAKTPGFARVRADMATMLEELAQLLPNRLKLPRLAAE